MKLLFAMCLFKYILVKLIMMAFVSVTSKVEKDFTATLNCHPPTLSINATEVKETNTPTEAEYRDIREIKFFGVIGPLGDSRRCKIKCIGGQWVGPLCVNEEDPDSGRFHPLLKNCKLDYINPHIVVTFRNVSIQTAGWIYPHGARLQIRCRDLGLYKLLNAASPRCQNGVWSHKLPSCLPTTLLSNFSEEVPPTILVTIPSGSAAVEPQGDLAVFPGSTIHLECLFSRRLGTPDWSWNTPMGQYLTGWAIAPEERDWKYRLSIYYSKFTDSGIFTCGTPRGITNSVSLHIVAVHCSPIHVLESNITVQVDGTRLGHTAIFSCPPGLRLSGSSNLTCEPTGKWSAEIPTCEPVSCPYLIERNEPHLKITVNNAAYGGIAAFECNWGYKLKGHRETECGIDGKWIHPSPKCIPIQCKPPPIPKNGRLLEAAGMDGEKYAVGSLVQYECNDSSILEGGSSSICTETGYWSHPPPFCNFGKQ